MLSSLSHRLSPRPRDGGRLARAGALRLGSLVLAVALLATAACDDPFEPRATTPVRTDSFVAYAMSGTPVNVPTAFNVVFFTTVRMEPSYGFDFAFDLDDQGRVLVVPVTRLGGAVIVGRRVGLQKATMPFDQITRAPVTGYHYDSTLAMTEGETMLVEVLADQCPFGTSSLVYSKFQVRAVDTARRRLAFLLTYDPNCGFRSFLSGIPSN